MAAITYTIKNLSQNNETAIINAFEITTNLSQQQHYLNLSGWNPPFDTYTSFTGPTTLRSETKILQDAEQDVTYTIQSFTNTQITFLQPIGIGTNWTPVGEPFQSNQTIIAQLGTSTFLFSGTFDVDPIPGESITFIPPRYLITLNNTDNLSTGWIIEGNGYSGQTVIDIIPPNIIESSSGPSTTPTPGQNITITSDFDNMFEIPAGGSKTFSMDYTNVTSTLGTYTSLVQIYATLDGAEIIKNVNNFMVISAVPVTDPTSPYYYGDGDAPADPGPDCGDTGSGNDCGK